MALNFLLKRSGTADKRPDPASMALGELDLNYDATTGGVFYKDSNGDVVKVGSAQVSATAPNATPAGSPGNSTGEFWLDTTSGVLYIWDGSAWADTSATAISDSVFTAAGDILVGTGASSYTSLPVGTDGQTLIADSTCAEGVKWGASIQGYTCGPTSCNTAYGFDAGCAITTGTRNVMIGACAGDNITTGNRNIAIGADSLGGTLGAAIEGTIAIGTCAMAALTAGNHNIAVGTCASYRLQSGPNNIAIGCGAGCGMTSAGGNVYIGEIAGGSNITTGNYNIGIGRQAVLSITSGTNNIGIGNQSLRSISIGGDNVALGPGAGFAITTGCDNTFLGRSAGNGIITGNENTIVGQFTTTVTGLSNNVVLADGAGSVRFQSNASGAWSPDGVDYGTSGQFLQSSGTGAAPTWGTLPAATTTTAGIVQLNDTTSSTSTTEALTANQGKELQDQINALAVSSNITLAGTIDASTGNLVTVTTEGTTAGFAVGSPLPTAAAGNDNYFVIVTVEGTMTPPGGSAQECHQGDWFLSDGSAWVFLDVGFNATAATTSTPGVVQLATDAEVQAGVNTDHAVTPSGLQSKVSDSVSTASSTTLASSQAVKTAYDAANSSQSDATQALSDAAAAQATADAAIPCATLLAKGNLIGASGAGTPVALPVGTDGQVLTACAACASGLTWVTSGGGGGGSPATPTAAGTLYGCSDAGGKENTSVGFNSLLSVTTGNYNVALGAEALRTTTTGALNTALGGYALCTNLGGSRNVATGLNSLRANTSGNDNTAVGFGSMFCNTAGALNTALGSRALYFLVSGNCNTLLGACTGSGFGLGSNNVIIGAGVNIPVNNASCQLAIGYGLTSYWLTGCSTGAIRPGAGIIDCAGSCGTAGQVLSSNGSNAIEWISGGGVTSVTAGSGLTGGTITTSGTISLDGTCVVAPSTLTAKGDILTASAASTPTALSVGTDGQFLVADSTCTTGLAWTSDIAPAAITDCTGGTGTAGQVLSSTGTALEWVNAGGGGGSQATPQTLGTVYGYTADSTDTTSPQRESTIIGWSSIPLPNMINSVGLGCNLLSCGGFANNSVVIGNFIGNVNALSGNSMVIIGNAAAQRPGASPSGSVVVGDEAGRCVGGNNTYIGRGVAASNQGCRNTAVGCGALFGNGTTSSALNTALGASALNTTGSQNTALGASAGNSGSSITGNNNTFVGFGALALGNGCSNHITLGNASITTIRAAVTTITSLSDARDKTDIVALPIGLDFVNALNPVKFTWQQREPNEVKDGTSEAGFIAQDLQKVQAQFGTEEYLQMVDGGPDRFEASPGKLLPVLVKAIQELSAKNDALEARLAALEGS